jgi:hypothetical protein
MIGPSTSRKGPSKVPAPGQRPSFILGSRPENMRAALPGARIKPGPANTTQYGKAAPPNGVASFSPTQGP